MGNINLLAELEMEEWRGVQQQQNSEGLENRTLKEKFLRARGLLQIQQENVNWIIGSARNPSPMGETCRIVEETILH